MHVLTRQREPELMDDPALDRGEHQKARRGLARLNAFSGAASALWRPIKQLIQSRGLEHLRVLDIATGGADVPLRLWRIARRQGHDLQIDGCDFSDTALEFAREEAERIGAPCRFFPLNVFSDQLPKDYDVIMASLFTHHLSDEETVSLLRNMKESAMQMVIVNDLKRSSVNLKLVSLAARLVTNSHVVHFDAGASVRNAYSLAELQSLAADAGMDPSCVREEFPCRMMLVWTKTNN